jgi:CRISPR-associated protein Csb2
MEQARAATGIDLQKGKHSAAENKRLALASAPFPTDLIDCLQAETGWLRKLGWSQPPGSRKVHYWRRRDSLQSGATRPRPSAMHARPVQAMLLAIGSASGNSGALPRVERSLPQGELLHRALVANAARVSGHSIVLSGCDGNRRPLTTPHQHAHVLHLDLDGDDHLDHVLIWAPMGLDANAQAAIRATRRSFMKGGTSPLRLAVAGAGSTADLMALPPPFGDRLGAVLASSSRWRSLTPFVPPRFLKRNGRNTLLGQVNAELASRGLPQARSFRVLDPHEDEEARVARHFKRARQRGARPPQDIGFMLELHLETATAGPLALGYGSHYGLGLFSSI